MAVLGTEQYNGSPLFVSPDNLMLHHESISIRGETQGQNTYADGYPPATHHQAVWASQQAQRPGLSLPPHSSTVSGWPFPNQTTLHNNLPPTPTSPFRQVQFLSAEEKLNFLCPGGFSDCWNPSLCPKHRVAQDVKNEQSDSATSTPPEFSHQPRPEPSLRTRSVPSGDVEPPDYPKTKRHSTVLGAGGGAEMSPYRYSHAGMGRDARLSISKGRVPHNLVERRYRDNLNNQIEALRMTLPSLRDAVPCAAADLVDDPSASASASASASTSPRMPSKAVIISTAATYIRDMETERARLLAANGALQEQVSSLQKLVRCDNCDVLQYFNAVQLNNNHHHHHRTAHLSTPS